MTPQSWALLQFECLRCCLIAGPQWFILIGTGDWRSVTAESDIYKGGLVRFLYFWDHLVLSSVDPSNFYNSMWSTGPNMTQRIQLPSTAIPTKHWVLNMVIMQLLIYYFDLRGLIEQFYCQQKKKSPHWKIHRQYITTSTIFKNIQWHSFHLIWFYTC